MLVLFVVLESWLNLKKHTSRWYRLFFYFMLYNEKYARTSNRSTIFSTVFHTLLFKLFYNELSLFLMYDLHCTVCINLEIQILLLCSRIFHTSFFQKKI